MTDWRTQLRMARIRLRMALARRPIAVFGDSIVGMAKLPPTLFGSPAVNAGIGGATIGFLADRAHLVAGASLVVVSVGLNDIRTGISRDEFKAQYARLRRAIGPPAVFLTLTNLRCIDVEPFNSIIWRSGSGVAQAASDGRTVDGVHLTPHGYEIWLAALATAVHERGLLQRDDRRVVRTAKARLTRGA